MGDDTSRRERDTIDLNQVSINPKDLTNEELEYVIKTGKIPPKFLQAHQTPVSHLSDGASINTRAKSAQQPISGPYSAIDTPKHGATLQTEISQNISSMHLVVQPGAT